MLSIKLTPLVIFLILISVLVISYIFGYKTQEGLIGYRQSMVSLDTHVLPVYCTNRSVYKLYDNLYFDTLNANLIELNAAVYNGNVDLVGNTITGLTVLPREGKDSARAYSVTLSGTVPNPQNVELSLRSTVANAFNTFTYNTTCTTTDRYFVTYIPFDNDTYIHIFNNPTNSTPTQVGSFIFGSGNTGSFNKMLNPQLEIPITGTYSDVDNNNNNYVTEHLYNSNKNIYQISKYVKYDLSNANLIIQKGDGSTRTLDIYNRKGVKTEVAVGGSADLTLTTIATVSNEPNFNPFTVYDESGKTMVLYMPIAKNTVVVSFKYDPSTKVISLGNVCRFDNDKIAKGGTGIRDSDSGRRNSPPSDSAASEYYKWYWYWKASGDNGGVSNDYMLKTKVVPPVCPACPACTGGSACTNCGGRGGSGTMSGGGGSMVADANAGGAVTNVSTNASNAISNVSGDTTGTVSGISKDITGTVNTGIVKGSDLVGGVALEASDLAKGAGSGAASLARDAASGTGSFIKDAASGTGSFIKDAASGTAGFVKDTASGAVGIGKDVVGGTVGLAKDTIQGAIDLTDRGTNGDGSGDGDSADSGTGSGSASGTRNSAGNQVNAPMILGTQNQYSDQYSYYGTLPAKKGSNFMPITADFSRFGK